jgi:type I restriction enzyme M protein
MALTNQQLNKYWDAAEILRKDLDAAEYKHIVLGLVFLKYVSDSFAERRDELSAAFSDPKSDRYKPDAKRLKAALDDRNYYKEVNVFWVPESSRWEVIQQNAKQPDIASQIDNALYEIEKENPKLEGIVERRYAEAKLQSSDLGAVVDLVGSISFGNGRHQASDVLGQVYEFFLGNFASAEGKNGGQFYTTPSVVKTLVEILQPTSGRIYDPCCGSGGMFVQSERFLEAHGGKLGDIAIYGQESNRTTRRLCAMNLAIRGIDFDLGRSHGDTFTENQHIDKRFDYILMNPPFGKKASYPREQLINDVRWKKFGVPRERPANYAWMSHAIHHLTPKGRAGIVMARGTLTSSQGGDDLLRKAFLDADLIECIIDLPPQLFFNTPIPSCLWFFNKDKSKWKNKRENQVLFIDARKLGSAISRTQIEFSELEVKKIAETFNRWSSGEYNDIDEFCKSVTREEIIQNGLSLSPGRYIGTEELETENHEDFSTRMQILTSQLSEQLEESRQLEIIISEQLKGLGYVMD